MYIIRPPPMSTRLAKDSARDAVESEAQAQAATTHEKAVTATAASCRPPRAVADAVGRIVMAHSLRNRAGLRGLHAPSCLDCGPIQNARFVSKNDLSQRIKSRVTGPRAAAHQ